MFHLLSKVHPIWILLGFFALSLLSIFAGAADWNPNSPIFVVSFVTVLFVIWFGWPLSLLLERMRTPNHPMARNEIAVVLFALVCAIVLVAWTQIFEGVPNSISQLIGILLLFIVGYTSHLYAAAWRAKTSSIFKFVLVFLAIYFLPIGAFFLWHISRRAR